MCRVAISSRKRYQNRIFFEVHIRNFSFVAFLRKLLITLLRCSFPLYHVCIVCAPCRAWCPMLPWCLLQVVVVSEIVGLRAHLTKPIDGWASLATEEGYDIIQPTKRSTRYRVGATSVALRGWFWSVTRIHLLFIDHALCALAHELERFFRTSAARPWRVRFFQIMPSCSASWCSYDYGVGVIRARGG